MPETPEDAPIYLTRGILTKLVDDVEWLMGLLDNTTEIVSRIAPNLDAIKDCLDHPEDAPGARGELKKSERFGWWYFFPDDGRDPIKMVPYSKDAADQPAPPAIAAPSADTEEKEADARGGDVICSPCFTMTGDRVFLNKRGNTFKCPRCGDEFDDDEPASGGDD